MSDVRSNVKWNWHVHLDGIGTVLNLRTTTYINVQRFRGGEVDLRGRGGRGRRVRCRSRVRIYLPTLEATQGQIDGFLSKLPYKCHQNLVAYVED